MTRRALFLAPQYDGGFVPHLPGAAQVERELKAVLEANGHYEFKAARRTLRRAEFHRAVTDLTDCTGEILLYFYGHGVIRSNTGVFVTSDGEPYDEGVRMREVIEMAFQCAAREVVIILDCCHAGAAAAAGKDAIQSIVDACHKAGRVLIAGCAAHQQGWTEKTPDQKQVGVFSWHILKGLNGEARLPRSEDVRGSSLGTYVTDAFRAWNQSPLSLPFESGDQRCVVTTGFRVDDAPMRVGPLPPPNALIFGVPFRPSQLFVGRNAELETLRTRLTGGHKPIAVSATVEGLGGIGKTELVIQLLGDSEVLQAYSTIVWIDGAGPLPPQWQKIGEELGLESTPLEPKVLVDRVAALLKNRGHTLIILDNATEWHPVEHLIPTGMSLLVTTRTRDFGGASFRHLELDILSDVSAHQMLVQMVPRLATDPSLSKLLTALGGHALALEIAGGTINALGISASEYLSRLDTRTPGPKQVLSQIKHGKTVDECLSFTWETLQSDGARTLWRRASLFAPTSAHRELLRVSFSGDSETREELQYAIRRGLFDTEVDISDLLPGDFDSAYAELRARNVFSRVEGVDGERWAMHRLVRDFGRIRLKSSEFFAHSMAISEWLRNPTVDLGPEVPHIIAVILDSAKFGSEFASRRGGSRSHMREISNRSSRVLFASEYFLDFIREELRDPKAVTMLLNGLTDANDDVRKQSIVILETLPHIPEVIEGVANALDDPDPGVRSLARKTITESGTEKVIHVLEKTLASCKPRARVEAVRCLAKLGKKSVPVLRTVFEQEEGDIKFEAALGLAELGNDLGLSNLLSVAVVSSDVVTRERVLDAISMLPSEAVDSVYQAAIKDNDPRIRAKVLQGLREYPNKTVVKNCLEHVFDTAVSRTNPNRFLEEALTAVQIANESSIPIPIKAAEALWERFHWNREELVKGVARSNEPDVPKWLAKALQDDDSDTREAVIAAVLARGEISLASDLQIIVSKDRDDDVRNAASAALLQLNSIVAASELSFSGKVAKRIATAAAMGTSRNAKYVPELLVEISHRSPAVRMSVSEALGQIRSTVADESLSYAAQHDKSEKVRRIAAIALLRVRCPMGKDAGEDCGTAHLLMNSQQMSASEILRGLEEGKEAGVCPAMIRDLARCIAEGDWNDKDADVKRLLTSLTESEDWQTRVYAVTALARSRDKDAAETFLKLLDDQNATVRREAAQALGLIGKRPAKARLEVVATNDSDAEVRAAACEALRSI